jgi:hypothetical protein
MPFSLWCIAVKVKCLEPQRCRLKESIFPWRDLQHIKNKVILWKRFMFTARLLCFGVSHRLQPKTLSAKTLKSFLCVMWCTVLVKWPLSWRWKCDVPLKLKCLSTKLYIITSQKTAVFILVIAYITEWYILMLHHFCIVWIIKMKHHVLWYPTLLMYGNCW